MALLAKAVHKLTHDTLFLILLVESHSLDMLLNDIWICSEKVSRALTS